MKEKDRSSNTMKNRIRETIKELTDRKTSSKIVFVVLLVVFLSASVLVSFASQDQNAPVKTFIVIGNLRFPFSALTGVFSSLCNLSVILIVVLFGKIGFLTSMVILIIQFIPMFINIIGKNYSPLPGVFSNSITLFACILLYLNSRKVARYQQKLKDQALNDSLTHLPSRYAIIHHIHKLVSLKEKFALVLVDINNFKNINDTMGHNFGNRLLIEIANRWRNLAESGRTKTINFISRQGGDEFAIVIRDYNDGKHLLDAIKEYEKELEKVIIIDECDFYMTASFGYALFPDDTDDPHNLFSYADAAMYDIKRSKTGNHIKHFDKSFIEEAARINELERKIRTALTEDTLYFNFQPQFDMDHKLRGFETLARMKDADGKNISPGEFIPVAEKVGLIEKVDESIFRKSAEFFGKLIKQTDRKILLSINVSVIHLIKGGFVSEVREILKEYDIPPEQLEVEITESVMMEHDQKTINCIYDLKDLGCKIAIDDFGTGYSSLSYLNKIPADLLKIDKSFIDKMNENESSKQYVANIISIGHLMDFNVISEGVEEPEQLETLRSIGCDYIQGYIWGKPLEKDKAEELVMSLKD